jgi:hypothetical protein
MQTSPTPRLVEQRKIEKLLMKLAKVRPISAKPAPIADGKVALKSA